MSAFRIARISADTLAHRLADLYAHHPPYALREWLHNEATRLSCPTYQDPVTNDIVATAETLRQRDALVAHYTILYEQLHPRAPALGGRESGEADGEVAAWRRKLHQLMGCHHVRERHCPHRALDGFVRTQQYPTAAAATTAPPAVVRKDASIALHFVQQLLRNTPNAFPRRHPRGVAKSGEGRHVAAPSKLVAGAAQEGRQEAERRAVAGATITFVRPPEVAREAGVLAAVKGEKKTAAAADSRPRDTQKGNCAGQLPHASSSSSPAANVTSLDCMIGVGDNEAARTAAAVGVDALSSPTPAVPVRRGPRLHFRSTPPTEGVHRGSRVAGEGVAGDPFVDANQRSTSRSSSSSGSSSSSSSLSLPVAREEGEDALSLSESDEGYEEEEDEDEHEGVSPAQGSADDVAEAKAVDAFLLHRGSRQSSQYQTAAGTTTATTNPAGAAAAPPAASTTTTVDFLTSHTGGLLSAATLAGAPLTAAAVSRLSSSGNHHNEAAATVLAVGETSEVLAESQLANASIPVLAGYSLTCPFTLAELPAAEAAAVLQQPFYAQAHELNRLAGLRGRSCYQDPHTHCLILTSLFLEGLPHCYGEYCKHCPHGEICQRRQLHPARHHHHRHRKPHHRRHRRHQQWHVGKTAAAAAVYDPTNSNLAEWMQWEGARSSSSSSDGGSGSEASWDEEDEDDPAALRFFEQLDAADTPPPTTTAAAVDDKTLTAPQQLQQRTTSRDGAALRAFSSHSTPSSLSASSSTSSSASSESDGDEAVEDEQQRHHLLRSAALYPSYGDTTAGSAAGVVVQVRSLRDLLAWGTGSGEEDAAGAIATTLAGAPGSALAASLGGSAKVGSEMDVEELLRRHEASLEQYAFLDSSAL